MNKKTEKISDEESEGSGLPSYHTSPSPTSSSESEGDVIEYTASTPSQPRASGLRESRSLDLTLNQINRALGSFKIFTSQEYLRLKEQIGPEEINPPSRITDSGETTNKEEKRVNNKRGKPKKEAVKAATKANPDADRANEAAKPLTRSKSKTIASQMLQENQAQQQDENDKLLNEQQSSDQLIVDSRVPGKSGLTIKRIKKLDTKN